MSGIEAVLSRISEIESRFGSPATTGEQILGTVNQPATTSTAAKNTSASFASALSTVAATTGTPTMPITIPAASTPSAPTTPGASTTAPVTGTTTPRSAAPVTSGADLGQSAVTIASKYLGIPYKWGGTDPATGLDCSGLVQLVYGQLGVKLPRTAAQQARVGTAVPGIEQARPGDLIVFRGGHHIGIYLGDGRMIHAPKTGDVVKVSGLKGHGDIFAIRRLDSAAPQPVSKATSMDQLSGTFSAAEAKYGLPAGLLRAVATVESGGRTDAVSRAGAQGLMQIMPSTARGLGVNPFDPAQAIDGAARLLKSNLKAFGNLDLAIAAYNAGAGAVRRHHGIPPYSETQNYVRKVRTVLAGGNS